MIQFYQQVRKFQCHHYSRYDSGRARSVLDYLQIGKKTALIVAMCILFSGCNVDNFDSSEDNNALSISGSVSDAITGRGLEGVIVSTDPVSQVVLTDSGGRYAFNDNTAANRLVFEKAGYATAIKYVDTAGDRTIVDAQMNRDVTGAFLSASALTFKQSESTKTVVISSTTDNNRFIVENPEEWIEISPVENSISTTESRVLTVTVDRSLLSEGVHASKVVINSNVNSLVLDINVAVGVEVTQSDSVIEESAQSEADGTTVAVAEVITESGIRLYKPSCQVESRTTLQCSALIESDTARQLRYSKQYNRISLDDGVIAAPTAIGLGASSTTAYVVIEQLPAFFKTKVWARFEGLDGLDAEGAVDQWVFSIGDRDDSSIEEAVSFSAIAISQ